MKKIFLLVLSVVLSLTVILPNALTVMADSKEEIKAEPSVRASLIIRNPSTAEVSNTVTITVFGRYNHQPISGAEVYTLKIAEIGLSKPKFPPISNNITSVAKPAKDRPGKVEAATIANEARNTEEFQENGIPLGYTNNNGELACTVNETGHYALAAIKEEYAPGFAHINIIPAEQKALNIKAPEKAEVGESVTIKVFERGSHQLVANADIYALRIADVFTARPAEKPTTLIMTPQPSMGASEMFITTKEIMAKGILLGNTDDKGQVVYAFDKTESYVLAAIKDSYVSDFARIHIKPKITVSQKPETTPPLKPVTLPKVTNHRDYREGEHLRQGVKQQD